MIRDKLKPVLKPESNGSPNKPSVGIGITAEARTKTNMSGDAIEMITARLDRIEDKVDAVVIHMRDHPTCPAPGTCVSLEKSQNQVAARLEAVEMRVLVIEKWQSWIMGGGAILITGVTLFGGAIRKMLGLP